MSPRNSAAAVVNMMEKTGCHRLITTNRSLGSLIDGIKADFMSHGVTTNQLRIDEIPSLKDLYPALIRGSPNEAFVPFPPPALRASRDDILVYLHSSGSTGFPKPIPITNISIIHWCTTRKSLLTICAVKMLTKRN
jgi:acyl-coenzyme A synthetase/AMP-(fatty) acid ligase